jgi:hypothetical protein
MSGLPDIGELVPKSVNADLDERTRNPEAHFFAGFWIPGPALRAVPECLP